MDTSHYGVTVGVAPVVATVERRATLPRIMGLISASIVFSLPALAQESDLEELRAQIEALTKVVEQQSEEIAELKNRTGPTPSSDADAIARIEAGAAQADTVDTSIDAGRYEVGRVPDDAIVTAGDFEGSITLPGSTASMRIGGYVQADMAYDFDSLGFSDSLNLRTIPLDGSTSDGEQVFRSHARYTRLNLDVRDQTRLGEFRSFLEIDFFGSGNDTTNNYTPVLRHAAAGVGGLYVGQYWSQFVDIAASPEGPNNPFAVPIVRNPGIRYRTDLNENWRVA
ncbi:MAG: DcaP family trimeric outer membrane transporter, partial [Pseudomonadota bacterium]